jgi:hypothetical protein
VGFLTDASAGSVTNAAVTAQVAGGLSSAYGAYSRSVADRNALRYQAQVQDNAAEVSDWRAQDAVQRGQIAEANARMKAGGVAGAQRATFAARGLSLDTGSAYNILSDTKYMSDVDAATIRDNTAKEAWALRTSAGTERANAGALRARAGFENSGFAFTNSLLTSAGAVASSWYRLRSAKLGAEYQGAE